MAYFMIESRVRLRRRLLLDRSDLDASLRVARALRDVQQRVGAYLLTVTLINIRVGVIVGLGARAYGFDSPVMWGGIAALLNFLPYFGPLVTGAPAGRGGAGDSGHRAAGPASGAAIPGASRGRGRISSPALLERFTVNPVAILVAFSFFSWVWGALGAILSIPLLIILLALFEHMGNPNVVLPVRQTCSSGRRGKANGGGSSALSRCGPGSGPVLQGQGGGPVCCTAVRRLRTHSGRPAGSGRPASPCGEGWVSWFAGRIAPRFSALRRGGTG